MRKTLILICILLCILMFVSCNDPASTIEETIPALTTDTMLEAEIPTSTKKTVTVPVDSSTPSKTDDIIDDDIYFWVDIVVFSDYNDFIYFCETRSDDITKYSEKFDQNNFFFLKNERMDMVDCLYPLYDVVFGSNQSFEDDFEEILFLQPANNLEDTQWYSFGYNSKTAGTLTVEYDPVKYRTFDPVYSSLYSVVGSFDDVKDIEKQYVVIDNINQVKVVFELQNGCIYRIEMVIDGYYIKFECNSYETDKIFQSVFSNYYSMDTEIRENAIGGLIDRFNEYLKNN